MKPWPKCLRGWLLCTVALLAICLPLSIALAHAEPEESEPAADAVVTTVPTQVTIWFTQDLFRREGMNRIEVYAADGTRVDQDDPVIDDDNRRLLTVSLQSDLADGEYTVRWFALSSEDGHEGEGEFAFTVAAGATSEVATPITGTESISEIEPLSVTAVVTKAMPTEVATSEPTVAEEPTEAEPITVPTPTPDSSGPQCFGIALPFGLVLSAVWIGRRRTF